LTLLNIFFKEFPTESPEALALYFLLIPDDFFVLSKLTDSIIIGYFTGDIVNGSKVLLEIILNSNKSWKVLIRGKKNYERKVRENKSGLF
jgi:hypothetical protein